MNHAHTLVQAWHHALNNGDVERLVSVIASDVKIGGPRGITSGANVVRDWFGRANVRFIPLQWFVHENLVVVEQRGEWLDETGAITGTAIVATSFTVSGEVISEIRRFDTLGAALEASGLSPSDQVSLA